ncbi:MAG: hypothetical protein J6T16_02670, partial [Opitutales bacterium]|nr:hypothetical protein [Opitutales bacterium]
APRPKKFSIFFFSDYFFVELLAVGAQKALKLGEMRAQKRERRTECIKTYSTEPFLFFAEQIAQF